MASIVARGLLPGGLHGDRQCVHFSPCSRKDPKYKYGMRHDAEAVVLVDGAKAARQGVMFYLSEAGAILTPQTVPADCILLVTKCILLVTKCASGAILFDAKFQSLSDAEEEEEEVQVEEEARRPATDRPSLLPPPPRPTTLPPPPPRPNAPPLAGDADIDEGRPTNLMADSRPPAATGPPAAIECQRCRESLPIGAVLCPNCLLAPLSSMADVYVEEEEDIPAYLESTVQLADRFGVVVRVDQVKPPKCRRGYRSLATKIAKQDRRKERRAQQLGFENAEDRFRSTGEGRPSWMQGGIQSGSWTWQEHREVDWEVSRTASRWTSSRPGWQQPRYWSDSHRRPPRPPPPPPPPPPR